VFGGGEAAWHLGLFSCRRGRCVAVHIDAEVPYSNVVRTSVLLHRVVPRLASSQDLVMHHESPNDCLSGSLRISSQHRDEKDDSCIASEVDACFLP
jgi:hypothetical protein